MDVYKVDKTIIDGLKMLDVTSVSDAMDSLGIAGGLYGIKPVVEGLSMCGPAFTVHYIPCGLVKGSVGDFLDDVEPGMVCVLDNSGRDYCTVWGDIMALAAKNRGIAGTLIDGVCRDIPAIREMKYPIYTKGWYMVTGKDRVECDGINVPVSVSGVKVNPGDIIMADDTGALCIPAEHAGEVFEKAKAIADKEKEIEKMLKSGMLLREARKSTGYHGLQTKRG